MNIPLRVGESRKITSDTGTQTLQTDFEGVEFFTRGMADVIRYKQTRSGLNDLNISNSEHTTNLMLLAIHFIEKAPRLQKMDLKKILIMILFHDLGEVGADEDIIAGNKTDLDRENEGRRFTENVNLLPRSLHHVVLEVIDEYEQRTTDEARFVKLLDTLDGNESTATKNALHENRLLHAVYGRVGKSFINFQKQVNLGLSQKAHEWGFPEIAEYAEIVWQRLIELGVLENNDQIHEPVQLKFEFK